MRKSFIGADTLHLDDLPLPTVEGKGLVLRAAGDKAGRLVTFDGAGIDVDHAEGDPLHAEYLKAVFFGEGEHLLAEALAAPPRVDDDESYMYRLRLPVGVPQQKVTDRRAVVVERGEHEFAGIVPPRVKAFVDLFAGHGEGVSARAPHDVNLFISQPACDSIAVAGLIGSESPMELAPLRFFHKRIFLL